jgi:AhpD family alkylhydroperoxidase
VDRQTLLEALASLIEDENAVAAEIMERLRQRDGQVSLLYRMLSRRPDLFVPHVMHSTRLYNASQALDPKTAELAAVAAAAALMCEYCLDAHMRSALQKGATLEEIFDVLLVAGAIAESSTLAVAFRRFRALEEKHDETR